MKQYIKVRFHNFHVFPLLSERGSWISNHEWITFLFLNHFLSVYFFISFFHTFKINFNRHRHQPERVAFIISPVKCASSVTGHRSRQTARLHDNSRLMRKIAAWSGIFVFLLKPLFRSPAPVTQETNHSQQRLFYPTTTQPISSHTGCSVTQRRRLRPSSESSWFYFFQPRTWSVATELLFPCSWNARQVQWKHQF